MRFVVEPAKGCLACPRSRSRTRGRKPSEALGRLVRRASRTHHDARMRAGRLGIVPTLSAGIRRRPVHAAAAHRGAMIAARAPDSRTAAAAENLFRAVLVGSPRRGRRTTRRRYPRSLSTKAARASRAPWHPRGAGPHSHAHDLRGRTYAYWHTHPQERPRCPHLWRAHKTSSGADRDRVSHCTTALPYVRARAPVFIIFLLCPLPSHHYYNIIIFFSTQLSWWIENKLYLYAFITLAEGSHIIKS